jgi:Subunit ChlI of Mg-chelatase
MAVARALSVSLVGLAGTIIEIEAEISSNLPAFILIGLPDAALAEAKDRVRAALQNSGLAMPSSRPRFRSVVLASTLRLRLQFFRLQVGSRCLRRHRGCI